ncbi:hypothetical protein AFLA_007299 [Aspergillus flavus NRRL3357]|nr:hypothetical protein AFLA_007299 [Aspergillus flavus NRRL3357]
MVLNTPGRFKSGERNSWFGLSIIPDEPFLFLYGRRFCTVLRDICLPDLFISPVEVPVDNVTNPSLHYMERRKSALGALFR